MSKLVTAGIGAVLAVATWILLYVILGFGLGTSFIAFTATLPGRSFDPCGVVKGWAVQRAANFVRIACLEPK